MEELKEQIEDLIKHKNAVNKVINQLQEKILKLDDRITNLEARITNLEKKGSSIGPGFVVPVR